MKFSSIVGVLLSSLAAVRAQSIPADAPPPWNLEVLEGHAFVAPRLPSAALLPRGSYDPLEKAALENKGLMVPDLGLLLLVRYGNTPVGPYDELIYIPGRWAYANGKTGLRISRIYVSSNASIYNGKYPTGRKNWNIPKHLATFDWKTEGFSTTVSVSSADSKGKPFFSAKLSPATGPIPIEINSTLTGDYLTLLQPPIPASPTNPIEIGTDDYVSLLLGVKSKTLNPETITGTLGGGAIGDGVGFPNVTPLVPIGAKLTGTLVFPVPEVFDI